MTDLKKRIVFENESPSQKSVELSAQKLFEADSKFSLETTETAAEQELTEVLLPKKKHRVLKALFISGIGLTLWQSVNNVITSITNQDWLSLGWSGFVAGVALVGLSAIIRELYALKRLKGRQDTKEELQQIVQANGMGKAKTQCEKLAKLSQSELSAGFDKWQHSLAETHNDREVLELYDELVLSEQDAKVKKIVMKHATENALMVAVSPLAVVDMIFFAWRSIHLIEQVAKEYGITLGYWSRIRLLRLVLMNMAFAGAAEVVADASMELLSIGVAGKLSSRAAQGLGVGLLTARFGFKAISLMRPLPHIATTAPKLSDIRKALLGKLSVTNQND